jgi:citrate lyase synthetase
METKTIKAQTLQVVVNYLSTKPFSEVAGIINQIMLDVQAQAPIPAQEEEVK